MSCLVSGGMHDIGRPEEIAELIVWLLSDQASLSWGCTWMRVVAAS